MCFVDHCSWYSYLQSNPFMYVCMLYPQDRRFTFVLEKRFPFSRNNQRVNELPCVCRLCTGWFDAYYGSLLCRCFDGWLVQPLPSWNSSDWVRSAMIKIFVYFAQTIDCILVHVSASYTISGDQFNHHDLALQPPQPCWWCMQESWHCVMHYLLLSVALNCNWRCSQWVIMNNQGVCAVYSH